MDRDAFTEQAPGSLVKIHDTDPRHGEWSHMAFVPNPLPTESPALSGSTYRAVAVARAALAALDSTARRLGQPRLFRRPSLRTEAESTSALEGTYEPLAKVLTADEERPQSPDMQEILNYVIMAESAFSRVEEGRPLTVNMLADLQRIPVAGQGRRGHRRAEYVITRLRLGDVRTRGLEIYRCMPPDSSLRRQA